MNPHPDSEQAVVSEQALAVYGLHSQPFSERPAGTDYFSDPVMQMQLNMLQHNIKFSDMLQVLKGDAGSGKTALVVQMLAEAHDEFQIFVARGDDSLTAQQVINGMVRIFQQPVPDDVNRCIKLLVEHLRIRLDKSLSSVLIIENAHTISISELNALLIQTDKLNAELDGELRILLVAEPDIEMMLPELESKQLREGKLFVSSVRTLDRKRTVEYLKHRLQIAGLKGELPFSGRQLTDLYTNTDGLPQKIDVVAAQMLNQGASSQPVPGKSLADIPLKPIGAAAIGAIAISLLMFLFAGNESNAPSSIASENSTVIDQDEKVVQLAPTIIPSANNSVEDPSADDGQNVEPAPEVQATQTVKQEQPATNTPEQVTDEPPTDENSEAATITLLSESPVNNVFAESRSVETPLPPTAPTPSPEPPKPKEKTVEKPKPVVEKKPTNSKPAGLSDAEKWLLQQKPERYVIQLLASYQLEDLQRYAKSNNIEGKTALFETTREARRWHVLTYGLYASAEAARAAISKLPAALQRNTPWIRSIKSIQLALKERA